MTISEKKRIEDIQEKLEQLSKELNELKRAEEHGFEPLETDDLLTQAYN